MVQIIEAVYNNGKVYADNVNIPDNAKVLIVWDSSGDYLKPKRSGKKSLPPGIELKKTQNQVNPMSSFPQDAVEFQRKIRDEEWT